MQLYEDISKGIFHRLTHPDNLRKTLTIGAASIPAAAAVSVSALAKYRELRRANSITKAGALSELNSILVRYISQYRVLFTEYNKIRTSNYETDKQDILDKQDELLNIKIKIKLIREEITKISSMYDDSEVRQYYRNSARTYLSYLKKEGADTSTALTLTIVPLLVVAGEIFKK